MEIREILEKSLKAHETAATWLRDDIEDLDREHFKISIGQREGAKVIVRELNEVCDLIREELML